MSGAGGGSGGGPCGCDGGADPGVIGNAPGLSSVAYRASDFGGLRRALLTPRAGEQAIGDWRPAPGDLGLQALEWWAYLGDVLTFYNERYANESYLRTASQPQSVANLVALLGYAPAPGVAATGVVAATRKPGRASEPLELPAGMRISSSASAGVPSQTFELDAASSFSGPTQVPVTLPSDPTLTANPDGTYTIVLAGRVGVKPGERLLLMDTGFAATTDNWGFVTVTAVASLAPTAAGAPDTLVTFALGDGWGPSFAFMPALYELEAILDGLPTAMSAGSFATWWGLPTVQPPQALADATAYRLLRPAAAAAVWSQSSGVTYPILPPLAWSGTLTASISLSAISRAITPGELVLLELGGAAVGLGFVAATVDSTTSVSNPADATHPLIVPYSSLSVSVGSYSSLAMLALAVAQMLGNQGDALMLPPSGPGSALVHHSLSEVGTIIGVPRSTLAALPATVIAAADDAPLLQTTAILADAHGSGVPVTVTSRVSTADGVELTLTGAGSPPAAPAAALTAPLQLLPDLVSVSRGQTVSGEVLGSGNAAAVNQSFTLARSPLTYLPGAGAPTSTLAVFVDGLRWSEVASFYGQAPAARVYVVARSADQTVTTVTFGDGVTGARLPSGAGNVTATYRYGSGAASPPAGRLTTITQPQPNLASIQNPVAVLPGADAQAPGSVRVAAPASVSTFGRAISATDYAAVAARAPGVARVSGVWVTDPATRAPVFTVYVGDDAAAVTAAATALAGAVDPRRPLVPVAATPIPIGFACTLLVSADRVLGAVLAIARTAIADPVAGLFSPAGMGIGQPLYRSAAMAALSVPGVLAVRGLLIDGGDDDVLAGVPGAFFTLASGQPAIEGVSGGG